MPWRAGRRADLDSYLIEAGAQASPPLGARSDPPLEQALTRLPRDERDAFLMRLARGEPHLSLVLNRRLRELAGKPAPNVGTGKRRTWGELRDTAERLREEAEQRKRAAAEAKRSQELEQWSRREEQTWQQIDALMEEKTTRAYDEATTLLIRMRDVALYRNRLPQFQARLAEIQAQYPKRPALQERLRKVAQLQ